MDLTQICETITEPKVIIKTFKETDKFINLQHALEKINPTFIILYHISMTTVREIEVRICEIIFNYPLNLLHYKFFYSMNMPTLCDSIYCN